MLPEVVDKVSTFLKWKNDPPSFYRDIYLEEPYPYQKDVLTYVAKNYKTSKRIMVMSSSGTGKTKTLGLICLYFTTVLSRFDRKPYEAIIISGSLLQSKKVYEYIKDAMRNNPIIKDQIISHAQSYTEFKDGSKIKALPNSMTALQGQHSFLCIVDEAALLSDFQLGDTFRIVGADNGVLIWSGTPINYDSLFVREWENQSKSPNPEWKLFSWSIRDCPNEKLRQEYEKMKSVLPEDQFKIFWEGIPYALKGTLIPKDSLVSSIRGVSPFKTRDKWDVFFGIDWGFNNPTALTIVQTNGEIYEVLEAYQWSETDFDLIQEFIDSKAKSLKPKMIFTDAENKSENLRLIKKGLPVTEIPFNKERNILLGRLRDLFVKNRIFVPDTPEFQDLIQQLRVSTWEKKSGQDLVESLMLACRETRTVSSPLTLLHGRIRRRPLY